MRAAAILGLGCSAKDIQPFQTGTGVEWRIGVPGSGSEADVVLLFGGDGTIHRHLGQLVKLGLPVLIVPAGSGNDLARALGLRSWRDSLAAWRNFLAGSGNVRAVDLGVISPGYHSAANVSAGLPHYFCCVAGVGLDSEVTRLANRLPRWLRGNGGYALSLLPMIFRFAPLPIRILAAETKNEQTAWNTRSDQPTILAAFANAPLYGDGMKIAPLAKMDDGLLDICVITGMGMLRLLFLFPTVYSGRHLQLSEVSYSQAEHVRVESEHPLDVYADGEYVCQTPVEIGVQTKALQVIVP